MNSLSRIYGFWIIAVTSTLLSCESKDVKPITPKSLVRIYVSSSPVDSMAGYLSSMRFNFIDALYSENNFRDSIITGSHLSHIELANSHTNFVVDTAFIPLGTYNSLSFVRWHPSQTPAQLFRIYGTLGKISFSYWSGDKFSLNFPDSLLTISRGASVDLLVHFDLNKALNPKAGGVDISNAVDGNHDGYIVIESSNMDGNAALAKSIFTSIVKNISLEKL